MSRSLPRRRTTARLSILFLGLATLGGCRDAALALGSSPVEARSESARLLGALGARFGPSELDSAYATRRARFARSSLVPSQIYDDSSVWTSARGDARLLELAGHPTARGYSLSLQRGAPLPSRDGEYRHLLQLRKLAESEFEWRGRDDLGVGAVRGDALGDALTALFIGAERWREPAIRAQLPAAMPRTTAALGQLLSLDSITTQPHADGATAVVLAATVHPQGIAASMPSLARYLAKYVSPTRYHSVAFDDAGRSWLELSASNGHASLRFRVHDGSLAPLNAPPRRIPDTFHLRTDVLAKLSIFTVGVRALQGDVTLSRAPREKSYTVRYHQEPDWKLPPLVATFLRSPLRRPFDGEGIVLRYAIRDSVGSETLLIRDYRIAVRESAIVRWLGGAGNSQLSEFRKGAETEEERFIGEVARALQADASAMLGGGSAQNDGTGSAQNEKRRE